MVSYQYKVIYNHINNLGLWEKLNDYLRMTDLTVKWNHRTNQKQYTEVGSIAYLGV